MTAPLDQMWIGGRWTGGAGGRTRALVDPGTEQSIAELPYGDGADARAALDAAADAFPAWSARTAYDRAALLDRAAALIGERVDDYARRTTEESGKPLSHSRGVWTSAPT